MTAINSSPGFSRLRRLIQAGGWRAEDRFIAASMPHFIDEIRPADTIATLRNLGLATEAQRARLNALSRADLPCLFVPDSGSLIGVLERHGARLLIQKDGADAPVWVDAHSGPGHVIRIPRATDASNESADTLGARFLRFRSIFGALVLVSFITNLLAFAAPIFVMAIYDRVIPTGSAMFLTHLLIGMGAVLGADMLLRVLRSRALSHVGGEVDRFMGRLLFRKLMMMPLDQLLKSDVDQQLSRLRQFESLREAFTGQALISFLDLPFTLMFIAVIWMISPTLGLAIGAAVALYALAFAVALPIQRELNRRAASSRLAQQTLQSEIIAHQRSLNRLGAGDVWLNRASGLTAAAASDARIAREASLIAQAFGKSLMMLAGGLTIFIGARAAIEGDITLGALVATMALVWRVLAPIQALYAAGPQIAGYIQSYRQIGRILRVPEETRHGVRQSQGKAFEGAVEFTSCTFRYLPIADPVVTGLSFKVEPGEFVVVAGPNGAGKSTVLKLLANLHTAQAGSIMIDGMDHRQIPVDVLREAISFTPQHTRFIHGTIAQNFRFANILASDEEIWACIRAAGLEESIRALPEGIHSRITEEMQGRMSRSVLQALAVARGFVKDAAIYVFDEPANGLDRTLSDALLRRIEALRGHRTVLMTSRFETHLRAADRVLYLEAGRARISDRNPAATRAILGLEDGIFVQ